MNTGNMRYEPLSIDKSGHGGDTDIDNIHRDPHAHEVNSNAYYYIQTCVSFILYGIQTFINQIKLSIASLKTCPKELYVNYCLKFCESYNYFALSQVLVIYLHTEFGLSDIQAGASYGLWGASITFWGLLTSYINDK